MAAHGVHFVGWQHCLWVRPGHLQRLDDVVVVSTLDLVSAESRNMDFFYFSSDLPRFGKN